MANATFDTLQSLPPLPSYTLYEQPPLIPGVPDVVLQLVSIVIAYWAVSGFFHILDTFDLCAEYRLHTPAELLKRNHVTRYEVFRDVVIQQILQTFFGLAMAYFDPPEMIGREDHDIASWALLLRKSQHHVPSLLSLLGVNAQLLATRLQHTSPVLSSILSGGIYPNPTTFASWELTAAKSIYHIFIPFLQFSIAIIIVDTWQYFLHRAMHQNRFLYNWLHSRHHRLYVPYAYGALYNHPIEGFVLDTLGSGIGYLATRMTVRQGMVFFVASAIKTVDDHCGYAFPWDPLQHITKNNAAYHDIHHQSWGVKTNFSQPFFTFWDRWFETEWKGGDVKLKYERERKNAQRKVDAEKNINAKIIEALPADAKKQAQESQDQVRGDEGERVIKEEVQTQTSAPAVRKSVTAKKSNRRRTGSFDPRSALGVAGLHPTPILHADGIH